MLSLHTLSTPGVGSNSLFFSESGYVAYQIKVKEVQSNMQCNTLNLHTSLDSGVGFERSDIEIVQIKIFFIIIKLSTKTCLTGICYDINDTGGELRVWINGILCFLIYICISKIILCWGIDISQICLVCICYQQMTLVGK